MPLHKIILASVALALLTSCGGNPLKNTLTQSEYYRENAIPFQPKRIWRLKVSWEPYLLDDDKAMLVKQFQYVVHHQAERARLEKEIAAKGGDTRYLRWFEAHVFPLGNWEVRNEAKIVRLGDMTLVTLVTKALKESEKTGMLTVEPIAFPDLLFKGFDEGCPELSWDIIPKDESVGLEVVLESRELQPKAERWKFVEKNYKNFYWRAWSVGQERSIAYRTLIHFKTNVARCPLPPKIHEEFKRIRRGQPMGVEW